LADSFALVARLTVFFVAFTACLTESAAVTARSCSGQPSALPQTCLDSD
jgi:hypothetical protein